MLKDSRTGVKLVIHAALGVNLCTSDCDERPRAEGEWERSKRGDSRPELSITAYNLRRDGGWGRVDIIDWQHRLRASFSFGGAEEVVICRAVLLRKAALGASSENPLNFLHYQIDKNDRTLQLLRR